MIYGRTSSCGCISKKRGNPKHRKYGTRAYKAYHAMKTRCLNRKQLCFRNYGGRGIKICDRWLRSFTAFHKDMGDPPSPKHTLDRIDNDGDYCPENCRWATRKEQMHNVRYNVNLTYRGKTMCVQEWARELNMPAITIYTRVNKGWPAERVLTPYAKER